MAWLGSAFLLLMAAGPKTPIQVADIGLLAGTATPVVAAPAPAPVSALQPAPVPNPDLDVPNTAGAVGRRLAPRLFSEKVEFQGNGYSGASSQRAALEDRRQPAAGLSWSVPVQY